MTWIDVPDKWIGPRDRGHGKEDTLARQRWMVGLLSKGYTVKEIAAAVRISERTVYKAHAKIRGTRTDKPRSKRNPMFVDRYTGYEIRRGLTDETQDWLVENCPDGVTIGAFIASIVTDTYAEETDAGTR